MFPTVSHIIKYLTGFNISLPLQTFGTFMVIGFIVAYYVYRAELKRKEKEGWLKPFVSCKKDGKAKIIHPYQLMDMMLFLCGLAGLAGAFLFDKLEHVSDWIQHPARDFFRFDGLSFYGGLIAGILVALLIAKKYKIGLIDMMDMGTCAMMLSYGIGRLGCHLSGDGDWGIVNNTPKPDWLPSWAWSSTYPHNVLGRGDYIAGCDGKYCNELPVAVFPTSLYEAIICFAFFILLWNLRKRLQPGMLFGIYCLLNGVERLFMERIKINPVYHLGPFEFTQAMAIAVGFLVTGLFVIGYIMRQQKFHFIKTAL